MKPQERLLVHHINRALTRIMGEDERVLMIGEDLLDPYGGAFKVTKGLSTQFPQRVHTTPISEAAIVGVATGAALRGMRPVCEIMFGDFLGLAFDQILNHATKYPLMYAQEVGCPITIRTPMGGRRGYGPTHSQSLEKFFVGIPGLEVTALHRFQPVEAFYRRAILQRDQPSLIIENKIMYGQEPLDTVARYGDFQVRRHGQDVVDAELSLTDFAHEEVTLITYGGMTDHCLEAARRLLLDEEIASNVLVLGRLSPVQLEATAAACARTGRVLIAEEGTGAWGIGSEWAAQLTDALWGKLKAPIQRVACTAPVLPNSRALEEQVLPSTDTIIQAVQTLMSRT
ncbi:alpha-ketoacid dehydrogenase subunit beta [Acanthopleuribacter pedis]|uniref:Transketolase-like pyrimidine-binding domain-containing protein n=1 Tax=Acanthopleuribacter pedis TaxID=442870 RepID=A0A8J7Q514_9BACT|nr:transketolase C-terminal domain-containing protein [Acanthopleuribacter pedis]MBO1318001.1 hypothetical protein [Acanthopleuribacter pedis]